MLSELLERFSSKRILSAGTERKILIEVRISYNRIQKSLQMPMDPSISGLKRRHSFWDAPNFLRLKVAEYAFGGKSYYTLPKGSRSLICALFCKPLKLVDAQALSIEEVIRQPEPSCCG